MSKHLKGIYERDLGSGVWWIRFADAAGRIRREKSGPKSHAIKLYQKRKAEVLEGKKLPEHLRAKAVSFRELASDALEYSRAHKLSHADDAQRMEKMLETFGAKSAEALTPQDIERWLSAQSKWKPATCNRYRALLSLTYRLGIANKKVSSNPARLVKSRRENNARTRYLLPAEEAKLRTILSEQHAHRLPELDLALHTGMRRGEQYGLTWNDVNLDANLLTIPRSKHGEKRHVFLNDAAVTALRALWKFSSGEGRVFANAYQSEATKGAREWFEQSVRDAGLQNFRWHDLRHTFASRLVMAGVDIRTVQELMGHKTITVTLRYAHLAPQHQLAAVQRLCDTDYAFHSGTQVLRGSTGPTGTKTSTSVSRSISGTLQGLH